MKLLIFDTETTGLPRNKTSASQSPNNWPHIVSISWLILDTETNEELISKSYIVRPNGWYIPEDSVKIHGITTEYALKNGKDLYEVIVEFINEDCDAWVAHNLEFDINVVINATIWDLNSNFPAIPNKKLCTMLLSRNLCKLPGSFGKYKLPKLKELYNHVFGKYPDELQLHNSFYDVRILTDIIKTYSPLRSAMGIHTNANNYNDMGK